MADRFTYWLEYLFLSSEETEWVSGFHEMLATWQFEACKQILARARRDAGNQQQRMAHVRQCEARLHLSLGEWSEAERRYRQALDLCADDDIEAIFDITSDLGLIQRLHGDLKKALHNHHLALKIAETQGWDDAIAQTHLQVGLDYEARRDLRRAKFHHQNAERIFRQRGDDRQVALTHASLALIELGLGNRDAAKALSKAALPHLKADSELLVLAQVEGNLGNIAGLDDDVAAAKVHYANALMGFRGTNATFEECTVLNNLGSVAYKEGDTQQAQIYYNEGLTHARALGYWTVELDALVNLSNLYTAQQNLDAAFEACRAALVLQRRAGRRRGRFTLMRRLLLLRFAILLKELSTRLKSS